MHHDYESYSVSPAFDVAIVASDRIGSLVDVSHDRELLCVLTAWKRGPEHKQRSEDTIDHLLSLGCKCFACFGPMAEELHDGIDRLAEKWQFNARAPRLDPAEIVTTWHDDEPAEDMLNYLLYFSPS